MLDLAPLRHIAQFASDAMEGLAECLLGNHY